MVGYTSTTTTTVIIIVTLGYVTITRIINIQ